LLAGAFRFGILLIYMSKIQPLKRISTLALRQRKAHLLRSFELPPDILHASLVERFMKCGKANCHCHRAGAKHGPCFPKGRMQSLLLKSPVQVQQARHSLAAYAQVQQVLDEISQLNHALFRRAEPLVAAPAS